MIWSAVQGGVVLEGGKPELAFSDEGSGLPVVLLHAFPLHRGMWASQITFLKSRFRVIAPDFRGFGESPAGGEEARMETFADNVRQLLQSLNLTSPVVLVGLSMGGYVAFEFARKYSKHLRGLILVATQPINDSETARQARYETADKVLREGTGILVERLLPKLLGRTTLETRPEVVESVRRLILDNPARGIAKACYALASRRDSTPVLGTIQIPALIVAGAEDPLIPERQLEVMQKGMSQARLTVIEQSGHLVNLEKAEEFNRGVSQFLESL